VGIVTVVVSVGVTGWLAAQRGVTVAGRRTLPKVRGLRGADVGGVSQASADSGATSAGAGW
jgi:hypothetical protein